MARFTGSFDFRISAKAHHTEQVVGEVYRTSENNIIESVRQGEFKRTQESDIRQSVVSGNFRRTAEFTMAGTLQSGEFRRTSEYVDYSLEEFTSEQARLIVDVTSSLDLVRVQSRVLGFLYNPRHRLEHESRIVSNVTNFRAAESFVILFQSDVDTGRSLISQQLDYQVNPVAQVDQVVKFNWTGTFDDLTRFGLAYSVNGGPAIPIDLSLPKTSNQLPTLEWKEIDAIESDQSIEYQIQVSKEFGMAKPFIDTVVTSPTYIFTVPLDYGIYYWRVKARDKDSNGTILDEGPWSSTFEFEITTNIVSTIPSINTPDFWNHPFLISPKQTYYTWRVSNLPSVDENGDPYNYRLRIISYQFPSKTGIPSQDEEQSSLAFHVRHTAANPPIFLRVIYDEQSHHVVMDVEINDSLGRLYQLKDFEYLNRDDIQAEWEHIEEHRIIGLTTGLNSNPTVSNRGYITWDASADADVPNYQTLDYNLRFLSTPEIRDTNFYYHLEVLDEESIINIFFATPELIFGDYVAIGKYSEFDLPYLDHQSVDSKDIYKNYTTPLLIPSENVDTISFEITNELGQVFNVESYDFGIGDLEVLDGFNGAKIYTSSLTSILFSELVEGNKNLYDITSLVNPNILFESKVGFKVDVFDNAGILIESYNTIEDLTEFRYTFDHNISEASNPTNNELYWDEDSKLLIKVPNDIASFSPTLNFKVYTFSFEYVNSNFVFPATWKDQSQIAPNYFNGAMIRIKKQALVNILGSDFTSTIRFKSIARDELYNIVYESPITTEFLTLNPIINSYFTTQKNNDYFDLMAKTPLEWRNYTGQLSDGEFRINLKNNFYIYSVDLEFISSPDNKLVLDIYQSGTLFSLEITGNNEKISFDGINRFADLIVIRFSSIRKVIVQNLQINSLPLLENIPTIGEGIFVDTDQTDIVMQDFVVNVKDYFDRLNPETFITPLEGDVILPEDENTDILSYYGLNLKLRLIISRDPEGLDILMIKTGVGGSELVLTPLELFQNNVTNVILEYKKIGVTFYEMSYKDAEIIEEKIGNNDYWITVRSRDYWIEQNPFMPIEYSPWSAFGKREKGNIYQIRWNIRGLNLPPTRNVYFRCRAVINSLNGDTEVPIVGFFAEANPQLTIVEAEKIATELLHEETSKELTELTDLLNSVETSDTITFNF